MDCIDRGLLCDFEVMLSDQVRALGLGRSNHKRLITELSVLGELICLGVDSNGAYTHLVSGPCNSASNFSTISYEQSVKHLPCEWLQKL
jgi:hypothetical protein